jgi:bifunctional DNA-binding transcriptional regulator/antitoxin component of YhaV-PrlF toxin-antitoxin module
MSTPHNLNGYGNKTTTTRERIGRVGQRRQVVIPREMLDTLHIREGDFVAFAEPKNGVLIKAKRSVDLDDILTPAEAEVARRGEAQLKRGQSKPWRDVKHALAR